jgi:hypothetical protein
MAAAGNPPTIAGNGGRRPDLTTVLGSCPRIRGFRNLLLVQRATATHISVCLLVACLACCVQSITCGPESRGPLDHGPPPSLTRGTHTHVASWLGAWRASFPLFSRTREKGERWLSFYRLRSTSFSDSENGAATDRFSKTAR